MYDMIVSYIRFFYPLWLFRNHRWHSCMCECHTIGCLLLSRKKRLANSECICYLWFWHEIHIFSSQVGRNNIWSKNIKRCPYSKGFTGSTWRL